MNTHLASQGLLAVVLAFCLIGCGYPEVSPKSYELATALYSACNRRSEEHLAKVSDLMETHAKSGDITNREFEWLQAIVEQAEEGDWEAAASEARQIMNDQVGVKR
ncbi:MAG: hypothetical protein KDA93_06810 [Planctomycetaceae bacterium]|nr:hypothetical protein [Planctomycetaceae bacterium]